MPSKWRGKEIYQRLMNIYYRDPGKVPYYRPSAEWVKDAAKAMNPMLRSNISRGEAVAATRALATAQKSEEGK